VAGKSEKGFRKKNEQPADFKKIENHCGIISE
jgi:hypothetical protein